MNKFKRRISIKLNKLSLHDRVEVTFVRASGERIKAKGKVGDSLLDVIVNSNLDFDGFGACEGTLTCSTCHLIFSKPDFDKLPEKSSDEELDMLDLAYDLTDTSRLGCQIYLSKDMNGLEVKVCELNFPPFHLSLTGWFPQIRYQQPLTMPGRNSRVLSSIHTGIKRTLSLWLNQYLLCSSENASDFIIIEICSYQESVHYIRQTSRVFEIKIKSLFLNTIVDCLYFNSSRITAEALNSNLVSGYCGKRLTLKWPAVRSATNWSEFAMGWRNFLVFLYADDHLSLHYWFALATDWRHSTVLN